MIRERTYYLPWRNELLSLLLAGILLLAATADGSQDSRSAGTTTSNTFLQLLTETERAWLRGHPVIRVFQDPGWPPVEFTDERGEPSGMAGDYLRLIEQRLGVKFEQVRNLSWQEAYARLKRWEIDMTTSVAVTPERAEFWAFTKPYLRIPIVIATNPDVTYIADMRELAGKKVAVVDGYAVNDWIPRDYPGIHIIRVKTAQEGLETLQRGDVFAYIDNLLIVGHYQAKMKITNIKIAGQTPYVNAQSMAIRKDWAILAGILDKALDTISETERNDIYRRWLPIRYEHGFDYTRFWQVTAAFALILLVLALWIGKLAREIQRRKKAEAASGENERRFRQLFKIAPMPLGLINKEGAVTEVNNRWEQTFGYTREEIPKIDDWWLLAYPDPDYRSRMIESWENAVRQARENNADVIEPRDYRVTCKNGDVRTMEIKGTFLGGDILAAFFDVTDRQTAEVEQRRLLDRAERARRAMLSTLEDQRRTEESLLESEAMLSRAQEIAHIGSWKLDLTTNHLTWSDEVYRIFGCQPQEFAATYETFLDFAHPDDRTAVDEAYSRSLRDGSDSYEIEHRIVRVGAGDVRYVHERCIHTRDEAGTIIQSIGMVQDITERKRAEAELAEQIHELRRWHDVMLDREDRIIEMKREVNELLARAGQEERYKLSE